MKPGSRATPAAPQVRTETHCSDVSLLRFALAYEIMMTQASVPEPYFPWTLGALPFAFSQKRTSHVSWNLATRPSAMLLYPQRLTINEDYTWSIEGRRQKSPRQIFRHLVDQGSADADYKPSNPGMLVTRSRRLHRWSELVRQCRNQNMRQTNWQSTTDNSAFAALTVDQ